MSDWQTVSEVNDDTWNREGTVQGIYIKKKTDVGANNSTMYVLKTDKGNVSIWGSAVLDSRFDQIAEGSEVRVTSNGKVRSKGSNREYYDYTVEFRPAPFQQAGSEQSAPSKPDAFDELDKLDDSPVDLDSIPF